MVKGQFSWFKANNSWLKARSIRSKPILRGSRPTRWWFTARTFVVQGQAGSHDSCFKANNSWLKARSIIRGSRPGRSRFKANPSRVPFKSPFRVPFTVPFRVTFWIPSV